MADPAPPVDPVVASVAPVTEAPVAPAPVVVEAPVVAAPPAEAPVVVAPVEAPVEVPVVAPAEVAPEAPAREATLAEKAKVPGADEPPKPVEAEKPAEPVVEAKPEEAPKVEEAPKPVEEKPAEAPVEAPAEPVAPVVEALEYKYELPEQMTLDDTQRTELHTAVDAYRADPSNLQPLLDLHAKRLQEAVAQTIAHENRRQFEVFGQTRANWVTEVLADEVLGGAGHDTAMGVVAQGRDALISDHAYGSKEWQADRQNFLDMMAVTGVGDNPVFLRYLYRVGQIVREPQAATSPVVNVKPVPQRGGGGNPLHDNPRSQQLNGRG